MMRGGSNDFWSSEMQNISRNIQIYIVNAYIIIYIYLDGKASCGLE